MAPDAHSRRLTPVPRPTVAKVGTVAQRPANSLRAAAREFLLGKMRKIRKDAAKLKKSGKVGSMREAYAVARKTNHSTKRPLGRRHK